VDDYMPIKPTSQHYNPVTKQLQNEYPDGMTPQQYARRNEPYQPKTLGEALTMIHNLRVYHKGLLTRIKNLEQKIGG
jgi:hypothetical protein